MSFKDKIPAIAVTAILIGGVAVVTSNMFGGKSDGVPVDVIVPNLSAEAKTGEAIFASNCAACHGSNASGSENGPPLVHTIYNPGHHGDEAFALAATRGVRQHHWKFGNMPPVPDFSIADAKPIVTYIRELQRANGIFYKPHNM